MGKWHYKKYPDVGRIKEQEEKESTQTHFHVLEEVG
jgi:hypothetical protein